MIRHLLLVLFSAARLGGHEKAPAPLGPVVPRRLVVPRRSTSSSVRKGCFGGGCKPPRKPIVKPPPQPEPYLIVRPAPNTVVVNTNERARINTSKNWEKHSSALSKQETEELYARHNRVYGRPTDVHGRTRQTKGRPQLFPSKWEGSEHQTEMTKALMEKDTHRYFSKQGQGTKKEISQRQKKADKVERQLKTLDEKKKVYDDDQFWAETLQLEAEHLSSQKKKPLHDLLAKGSYDFTPRTSSPARTGKTAKRGTEGWALTLPTDRKMMGEALENTASYLERHGLGPLAKDLEVQAKEAKEISRLHEIAQEKGHKLQIRREIVEEAERAFWDAKATVLDVKYHESRRNAKLIGEIDSYVKPHKNNKDAATKYRDAAGKAYDEVAGMLKIDIQEYDEAKKALAKAAGIRDLERSEWWHEQYNPRYRGNETARSMRFKETFHSNTYNIGFNRQEPHGYGRGTRRNPRVVESTDWDKIGRFKERYATDDRQRLADLEFERIRLTDRERMTEWERLEADERLALNSLRQYHDRSGWHPI